MTQNSRIFLDDLINRWMPTAEPVFTLDYENVEDRWHFVEVNGRPQSSLRLSGFYVAVQAQEQDQCSVSSVEPEYKLRDEDGQCLFLWRME